MVYYLLALSVITICLAEGIPMIKKRLWKELTVFGLLIGAAVFLAAGKFMGFRTPVDILYNLLSPLGKAIFKYVR